MHELLEYYSKEHFKLHFELNHYVHYQEYNGQWLKAKWQDIVTNPKGIKRIQYNTSSFKRYIIVDVDHEDLFKFENINIPKPNFKIGRARVGKECLRLCRSRWSPYH